MKKVWLRTIVLALGFGLYVLLKTSRFPQEMQLIVCDVGQGDAILITSGFLQVLIDGGPPDQVPQLMSCLEKHMPWGDLTIELVIPTHPDADHIGGLPPVLERYQVSTYIDTGVHKDTKVSQELKAALEKEATSEQLVQLCSRPLEYYLLSPEIRLWQLYPSCYSSEESSELQDVNQASQVFLLEFNFSRVLLTGDSDQSVEQALAGRGLIIPTQILKVGHHGSKTSSSLGLLEKSQPEIALISAGTNNRYGHPHVATLERLNLVGATTYRTDQHHTIRLTTDGQQWRVLSP